jgi:predicted lipoprotein with Yx(FWY)xxD motif
MDCNGMRRVLVLLVVAAALVGSGTAAPATSASLTVRSSSFGRILFDGRGFALYAFTKDGTGRSTCAGACAKAWPPFIVTKRPAAGPGARSGLIGTVRRSDGRLQATYRGRPLYRYVHDPRLQVLCQNVSEFGGLWLVVRPDGTLVRT